MTIIDNNNKISIKLINHLKKTKCLSYLYRYLKFKKLKAFNFKSTVLIVCFK